MDNEFEDELETTEGLPDMHEAIGNLCDTLDIAVIKANEDQTVALTAVCLLLSKMIMRAVGSNKERAVNSFRTIGIPTIETTITDLIVEHTTIH